MILLSLLFNIILIIENIGQTIDKSEFAKSATLIILLNSNQQKINALQLQKRKANCNESCKQKLDIYIHEIVADRDSFNFAFMKAMEKNFQFCKIVFCYDSNWKEYKNNKFTGKFLLDHFGSSYEKSLNIEFPIFLLKTGFTPQSNYDAMVFSSVDGNLLQKPFPNYFRINHWKDLWYEFLQPKKITTITANRLATKLNSKLYKMDDVLPSYNLYYKGI